MKFKFKKIFPKDFDFMKLIPDDEAIKAFVPKAIDFFKHLPQKIKSMDRNQWKKLLLPGLMVVFATTFLICAGVFIKMAYQNHQQAEQNNYLAGLVEQEQGQVQRPPVSGDGTYVEPISAFVEIAHPVTGKPIKVLREYASVYQLNPDMVGWVHVPGTDLNYPVVQTPDDPDYYLHRDFYKDSNRHGTVYADSGADLQTPSDNVTLYGHNMTDGSMFAVLHKYAKKEYWDANPYIYFDTLYEHRTYQIISVFEIDLTEYNFAYHDMIDANVSSFQSYMTNCKNLEMYDTGVTAKYGDKLLTLSTCDRDTSNDDIRFVIVAKLVT